MAGFLIGLATLTPGFICAGHALMTKTRNPASPMAWILVCLGLPLLGAFLYLTVGQDRVTRKRYRAVRLSGAHWQARRPPGKAPPGGEAGYPVVALESVLERVTGTDVWHGNAFAVHVDGEAAFPAMLAAVRAARESVCFQFYIVDDDRVGKEFRDALVERARAGVTVRVLYDAVGCAQTYRGFWEPLQEAGVMVVPFMPLRPLKRRWQINLRNHRKALIVDDTVAFFGSLNVSARHLVASGGTSHDLALSVRGPVVGGLFEVFAQDWFFAAGEELPARAVPPPVEGGHGRAQIVASGPDRDRAVFHQLITSALHEAREEIRLVTPYFIPDPTVRDALELAVRRGVDVRLLIPEHTDHWLVNLAARDHGRVAVGNGVRMRASPGPMLHVKLALIDREVMLVGSSNLDCRSFFLNFELDLLIRDRTLVATLSDLFAQEWERARPVSPLEELETGLGARFVMRAASLFSPLL